MFSIKGRQTNKILRKGGRKSLFFAFAFSPEDGGGGGSNYKMSNKSYNESEHRRVNVIN